MIAPRPVSGIGLAGVCLCILGIMPIISNSRPEGFDALGFAFFLSVWQVLFALPLFLTELRPGSRGVFEANLAPVRKRRALTVTLATGTMFGLSTYLYVLGVETAGAVSAAIAIQAYPLFAILWETLFLKRRKTPLELALTVTMIAGLFFLATGGTGRIDGLSPAFFIALGVPFLWSIAHVMIREELRRTPISPAQITFIRVLVSAVFLGVVLALVDPAVFRTAVTRVDFQAFAMVMGLVYYVELMVWFHAVRHIDVSLASSITTPWPALTMLLAALFLQERVEIYQIVAFSVVALSCYGLIAAALHKERIRTTASPR